MHESGDFYLFMGGGPLILCAHSAELDGLLGDGKDGEDWGYVVKQPEGSGLFKVQKGLKWISSSASLL